MLTEVRHDSPSMPHSLFISDLHLSRDHPHSMAEFLHFIDEFASQAEALYILGDLFEYWAGDDDLEDPFHAQVDYRTVQPHEA